MHRNGTRILRHIIDEEIQRKRQEIKIPPGIYYCSKPLVFTGLHQARLEGTGVQVVMTNPGVNAFAFHNCSDIVLQGFTIDYKPLPFTQATVVSKNRDATEIEFEIHDGYRDFEVTGPYGFGFRAEAFDPKTLLGKAKDIGGIEIRMSSPRCGCMKLADTATSLELGDYLAFVNRERDFLASALEFKHCSEVRLEDLTILASPGMAVYCADMDGKNYFRYIVGRGPQDGYGIARLISANADGLHYHCGRQGPVIERCSFSFMSDDSVNINGPSFVVKEIENSNDLWIEANEYNAICFPSMSKGDVIRFMSPENYDILAEARIEALGKIRQTVEVTDARLRRSYMDDYSGGLFKRGAVIKVSCDRPLKLRGNEYCNVFNLNCPGFKICDSFFHDHRAIGLRIFGTDGSIENNRIERTKSAAINVGPAFFGDHDGWGKNIQIRKNKINSCSLFHGLGAITISAAKIPNAPAAYKYPRCARNITVEDNTVTNCCLSGIFVNAADDVRILGNHICRTNTRNCSSSPDSAELKAEYAIDVQNSSHVEVENNKIERHGKFCSRGIRPYSKG